MKTRRVQKSGNAYYLTLPISWVNKHEISASTELSVSEDNGSLIIRNKKPEKRINSKELELKNSSLDDIKTITLNAFHAGIDKFRLKLDKEISDKELLELQDFMNSRGMEAVEINNNAISFDICLEIKDYKDFIRRTINKLLNIARNKVHNNNVEIIREQIKASHRYRFMGRRAENKHFQGDRIEGFTDQEVIAYSKIIYNLGKAGEYIRLINDQEIIIKTARILEKVLTLIDSNNIEALLEINRLIEEIRPDYADINGFYNEKRLYRMLKEIIQALILISLTKQ